MHAQLSGIPYLIFGHGPKNHDDDRIAAVERDYLRFLNQFAQDHGMLHAIGEYVVRSDVDAIPVPDYWSHACYLPRTAIVRPRFRKPYVSLVNVPGVSITREPSFITSFRHVEGFTNGGLELTLSEDFVETEEALRPHCVENFLKEFERRFGEQGTIKKE